MSSAVAAALPLWINGAAVAGEGPALVVRNPANDSVLAEVSAATPAQVDAAVASARAAFEGPMQKLSGAKRGKALMKLADLLRAKAGELAEMESQNTGKPVGNAKGEVMHAAEVLDYYAAFAGKVQGSTIPCPPGYMAYTSWEPIGVVGAIIPWNFPLVMAAWKLGPALAAGNAVVLKPSELTPLTALRLAELAIEAGLPAGMLNVVNGTGEVVGDALVRHPGVDKIAFTGGTDTGKHIMAAAAGTMKRLTMELGGKSAGIVFADANLEHAVAGTLYGIFDNSGQACNARSRVLVERSVHDQFVAALAEKAAKLKVGDPAEAGTQQGPLVGREHWEKVDGYVKLAVQEGAKLEVGGQKPAGLEGGHYYAPTVLSGVENTMRVAQEEVFGPVLAVIPFDTEAQAIQMANDSIYGLYGTVWTQDVARAHRVAGKVRTGGMTVNTPFSSFLGVPFGGYKQSGFGRELSADTIKAYLEEKSVLVYTGERVVNPFGV